MLQSEMNQRGKRTPKALANSSPGQRPGAGNSPLLETLKVLANEATGNPRYGLANPVRVLISTLESSQGVALG